MEIRHDPAVPFALGNHQHRVPRLAVIKADRQRVPDRIIAHVYGRPAKHDARPARISTAIRCPSNADKGTLVALATGHCPLRLMSLFVNHGCFLILRTFLIFSRQNC